VRIRRYNQIDTFIITANLGRYLQNTITAELKLTLNRFDTKTVLKCDPRTEGI